MSALRTRLGLREDAVKFPIPGTRYKIDFTPALEHPYLALASVAWVVIGAYAGGVVGALAVVCASVQIRWPK